MKYVTFAIMAVLIFGVAAAPVFSNGVVFAQTEREVAIEKKENTAAKKEASTEKKQNSVDKKEATAAKKEASTEKKQNSVDKKKSTAAKKQNSVDKKESTAAKKQTSVDKKETKIAQLQEQFANMPEERATLQAKLDAMKEKFKYSTLPDRHLNEEDKQAKLQEIRDKRSAEREARQNMTLEEKQALLDARLVEIKEKRENYVSPRDQVKLGLASGDIVCAEGKEPVVKISNDMPMCLGSDAVLILMDRGIIAYP